MGGVAVEEQRIPAIERHAELRALALAAAARADIAVGDLALLDQRREAIVDAVLPLIRADERVRVVEGLVATIKALRLVQEDWIDQNEKPVQRAERGKYRRVFNEAINAVLAVVEAAREDTTAEAQDEFHRQARALDAACTSDTDDPPDFKTEDEFDGYL